MICGGSHRLATWEQMDWRCLSNRMRKCVGTKLGCDGTVTNSHSQQNIQLQAWAKIVAKASVGRESISRHEILSERKLLKSRILLDGVLLKYLFVVILHAMYLLLSLTTYTSEMINTGIQ